MAGASWSIRMIREDFTDLVLTVEYCTEGTPSNCIAGPMRLQRPDIAHSGAGLMLDKDLMFVVGHQHHVQKS